VNVVATSPRLGDSARSAPTIDVDQTTICVVENPPDVVAVERSGAFHGTYHVLHGVLNPLEGVTPDRLRIQELILRLRGPSKK